MTDQLNYILWQPDLEAFRLGPIAVRWYGLMWIIGLALGYLVVQRLYKEQKIKDELFDPLFIYCFLGILIGARLGHCIFYEPDYFLTSGKGFVEMFLPIHFLPDGDWKVTGYAGLASHGGTLGLMIALWLYVRKTKLSIWTVLDNIAIATGTTACFIRLGNLMNSEIIGKITDVPWAFIFERVDSMPRHPGQLYEAIAYAILFCIMWVLHKRMPEKIYLHLPLLHRIHQGDPGSLRSLSPTRHGTDPFDSVCHTWSLLHDKSQKTSIKKSSHFPETIFLISLSLFRASRGVRLFTSIPKISSRT